MLYTIISVIKTYIFDVGGVLMEDADSFGSLYKAVTKMAGLTPETMAQIWARHYPKMAIGLEHLEDFFKEVTALSPNKVSVKKLLDCYKKSSVVKAKIITLIKNLRKRGFRLVILSNDTLEGAKIRVDKFKNLFDNLYVSARLSLKKPDPKIFEIIITREKINPQETLFIDDRERNILAAKALGFNTLHVTDKEQLAKDLK